MLLLNNNGSADDGSLLHNQVLLNSSSINTLGAKPPQKQVPRFAVSVMICQHYSILLFSLKQRFWYVAAFAMKEVSKESLLKT